MADDVEVLLEPGVRLLAERQGGGDAVPFEQFGPLPADAPDVADGEAATGPRAAMTAWSADQTPPACGRCLAMRLAALASVLVGPMPTLTGMPVHCLDRAADVGGQGRQRIVGKAAELQKRFVDGIDFDRRGELLERLHHAAGSCRRRACNCSKTRRRRAARAAASP